MSCQYRCPDDDDDEELNLHAGTIDRRERRETKGVEREGEREGKGEKARSKFGGLALVSVSFRLNFFWFRLARYRYRNLDVELSCLATRLG